jgi:hypothetical protein
LRRFTLWALGALAIAGFATMVCEMICWRPSASWAWKHYATNFDDISTLKDVLVLFAGEAPGIVASVAVPASLIIAAEHRRPTSPHS